jgi:hypothetical protein
VSRLHRRDKWEPGKFHYLLAKVNSHEPPSRYKSGRARRIGLIQIKCGLSADKGTFVQYKDRSRTARVPHLALVSPSVNMDIYPQLLDHVNFIAGITRVVTDIHAKYMRTTLVREY